MEKKRHFRRFCAGLCALHPRPRLYVCVLDEIDAALLLDLSIQYVVPNYYSDRKLLHQGGAVPIVSATKSNRFEIGRSSCWNHLQDQHDTIAPKQSNRHQWTDYIPPLPRRPIATSKTFQLWKNKLSDGFRLSRGRWKLHLCLEGKVERTLLQVEIQCKYSF